MNTITQEEIDNLPPPPKEWLEDMIISNNKILSNNIDMKTSDFKKEDELKKMKVADIKKHVREFNEHYAIKGYSKLKKDQLINAVLTAQMRISKSSTAKPVEKKQTPLTVTKGDGTVKELKKKASKGTKKSKLEILIPGININKDKNLKPLPKEFIPDENSLQDMKKYKKILDKKNKDKKISKGEYDRFIDAVNKQIKKLENKTAPKKEADTSDLKLLKSKIEEILPIFTEISPNKYDVKQRSKIVTLINRMRRLSQNVGKNKDVDNLLKLFNKLLAEDKNKKPILTDYTAMYNALDNVLKKIEKAK